MVLKPKPPKGDIVPRFAQSGVEALATVRQRGDENTYQVDRLAFVRPSAHLGRSIRERYALDGKDGVAMADSRSIWKKFPMHELPEMAYFTVNQDIWRVSGENGIIAPRGGLQNLILEWYHPSDPRGRRVHEALPYVEYWRYKHAMRIRWKTIAVAVVYNRAHGSAEVRLREGQEGPMVRTTSARASAIMGEQLCSPLM